MDKNQQPTLKKLFSFFKLTASQKEHALRPIDIHTWITHGISEFFGTLFLSLILAGLSIYVSNYTIQSWSLLSQGLVGFFSGFIVLGTALVIFSRWSCDLNPIISITKYLKGQNNGWYASYKIFMQFLAAFVAGAIILAIGNATSSSDLPNAPINAYISAQQTFLTQISNLKPSINLGIIVIFFTELVICLILLFGYFSPIIKEHYRYFMLLFLYSALIWLGILGGSQAANPARGLAQQLPSMFLYAADNTNASKVINTVAISTVTMLLAELISTALYVFLQGFNEYYFAPFLHKIIKFKNNHHKTLITNKDFKILCEYPEEDQKNHNHKKKD
ncbi:hypothetical protein NPA08_03015 [Mycoplasmopsis citelli]|uniref:hypothetical protein n=1 Tax=Mycoplasmopsis citelli TaxID=171281 RepID=UPI0021149FE6|nr:hypothetical protein [Mycoplasmopsis citelli]UUD35915.1 hypothetical protein NPA08_03015 [Mycoplasmopsis citelli]